MNIKKIEDGLKLHIKPCDLAKWIEHNEEQLSNYFHSVSGETLEDEGFLQLYFRYIWNGVSVTKTGNTATDRWLKIWRELLSIAAQKLILEGNRSVARNLVDHLDEGPGRYRLQAILEFGTVDDPASDYLRNLPTILDYLSKSIKLDTSKNLRHAIDVIIKYLETAHRVLSAQNLNNKYVELVTQIRSASNKPEFSFLNHQFVVDYLNGNSLVSLNCGSFITRRYKPSAAMAKLFATINLEVAGHRHIHLHNNFWGYTKDKILNQVLERGKTDFNTPFEDISTDDKVLLYCYFNMKKHYFTAYAVFESFKDTLIRIFTDNEYPPLMVELGCGPLTSGLALADLICNESGQPTVMNYIGVDIATAMLKKAEIFSDTDVFSPNSSFKFVVNVKDIEPRYIAKIASRYTPIILNASYLFASDTIDLDGLVDYIKNMRRDFEIVLCIVQNSARADRNVNYQKFKSSLPHEKLHGGIETVRYQNSLRQEDYEKSEEVMFEILKVADVRSI